MVKKGKKSQEVSPSDGYSMAARVTSSSLKSSMDASKSVLETVPWLTRIITEPAARCWFLFSNWKTDREKRKWVKSYKSIFYYCSHFSRARLMYAGVYALIYMPRCLIYMNKKRILIQRQNRHDSLKEWPNLKYK